jgi:hypothetical protein
MNLRDLVGALRRRWYLVVAGLLLTAAMCLGAVNLVPANYTATSSVLLLPPNNTVGTGGNPYLSLGGLQGAVDVLGRAMMGERTVDELTGGSADDSYTLEADATTSGPLLLLSVKSLSSDGALGLVQAVLDRAPSVLHDLQVEVNAPAESMINMSVIAQDSTAQADRKTQVRALIVALGAGLALTLFLTILLDTVIRRRGRRQAAVAALDPIEATRRSQQPADSMRQDLDPAALRSRAGMRTPSRPTAERIK